MEATRNSLDRLDRYAGPLGATTAVLHDAALADARRAEREILAGEYRGPLHGVPLGIKDLADVAGSITTAGSTVFGNELATVDARLVSRGLRKGRCRHRLQAELRRVRLPPHGRDLAVWPLPQSVEHPDRFWRIQRRHRLGCWAGLVYGGLGTDTGGSIRLPSALCGLVGIKPTYGRVSLEGLRLLSPSFDTPGPMARTRDAAVMLQAMADPIADETIPTANRAAHLTSEMPVGLEGLRVGVPSNYFFEDLDPEIERIVRAAVDALAILGGDMVQVGIPTVPDLALSQRGILTIEAYQNVLAATNGDVSRVNPTLRDRLKLGLDEAMRPGEDVQITLGRLRSQRDDALAAFRRAIGTVDVLVTPVLQRSPPPIDDALTDYHWMPNHPPVQRHPSAGGRRPLRLDGRWASRGHADRGRQVPT